MHTQNEADENYADFNMIKQEMYQKVNNKSIKSKIGLNNKKRRTKKPWWSEELTIIWNELCIKEKAMLSSDIKLKGTKRGEFLSH